MLPLSVTQIASLCGGQAEGEKSFQVTGVAALETAAAGDLCFATGDKGIAMARSSAAGCLLVDAHFENVAKRTLIRVADPRRTFAHLLALFYPRPALRPGIHPSAIISMSAVLGDGCYIGPNVVIGDRSVVGSECSIGAGCVIASDVTIGDGTHLAANVSLYERVTIGAHVLLHSGCVIGTDGFGFVLASDHYEKFPQVGTVLIEDDVELGANCCVDRAALGTTRIGKGTKLDNMVHVGHNCQLGSHVVIAAQTGLSGGVHVGDYAVLGGQVGVGDQAQISSKAIIGGQAGILPNKKIQGSEPMWGTPARPLKEYLKQLAELARLKQLRHEMEDMKSRVAALTEDN